MNDQIEEIINKTNASIEKQDLRILIPLLEKIHPTRILEIGSWKGYSAKLWDEVFSPIDQLITIEKSLYEHDYNSNNLMYIRGDSHSLEIIEMVGKNCRSDKVDFLFIDGDHSFQGVKEDWIAYSPLVRKGGVVVFHDVACHVDETEEVDIFWKLLKKGNNYVEIKSTPNSTGIGVLFL